MARVQLTQAHIVAGKKWKAGTIFADSQGVAQAGDVVWTGLNSMSYSNAMVALDAAAITMRNASRWPSGPTIAFPDGVNSVD